MSIRAFDLTVAAIALVVLSPLLVVIAAAVVLDSGLPLLFRQRRVGRDGEPFMILKFRTMRTDAESRGGPLTVGRDDRITRIGRVLRAWKLDELPQFWNVLVGEMSLVGSRPEVPKYVALYTPEQRRVLAYRPGITDPASIAYRNESELLASVEDPEAYYIAELMPRKLALTLDYLERRTLASDIRMLMSTARRILNPGPTTP